jgi:hypothetical protein
MARTSADQSNSTETANTLTGEPQHIGGGHEFQCNSDPQTTHLRETMRMTAVAQVTMTTENAAT